MTLVDDRRAQIINEPLPVAIPLQHTVLRRVTGISVVGEVLDDECLGALGQHDPWVARQLRFTCICFQQRRSVDREVIYIGFTNSDPAADEKSPQNHLQLKTGDALEHHARLHLAVVLDRKTPGRYCP